MKVLYSVTLGRTTDLPRHYYFSTLRAAMDWIDQLVNLGLATGEIESVHGHYDGETFTPTSGRKQ
jgi:hypothetical protein